MARKIIIDCDPGIDDAIAVCIALFDPRVEVMAITAVAGTVDAVEATRNVNAIVSHLDPPRYPRIGKAMPTENAPVSNQWDVHGPTGLGDFDIAISGRQHQTPSDKVISELAHQCPNEITLVCLGPLTNLSTLCLRDPDAVRLIDKVILSGGALDAPGNATPVAEFNMHFDPVAASEVFASPTTKSLLPLDVTDAVLFGVEILDQLPSKRSRAGSLLHQLLPFAFRTFHRKLGRELIPLYDPIALMAILEPSLFTWEPMAGKVETKGEFSRGATLFDKRLRPEWSMNMEVAVDVDVSDAEALVLRSLRYSGQQTE